MIRALVPARAKNPNNLAFPLHTMKLLLPALCLLLAATALPAQNYLMNNSPVTDCNGSFYDSGGPTAPYGNDESFTKTFCADGTGGTHVQLNFSGIELAPGDALCFYDGTSIAAPLLSCADDYEPGSPVVVQATAVNPSGCLTVRFESNGDGTASGWSAVINCVASCQTVLADLVSTNPAIVPADTGWIDVCPNERIFFNGAGLYPQNNFAYPQSDLTTTFEWNFGDGDISYGPSTSHRFTEPGGYYVQLVLVDAEGCRSTNLINQRVRVAPRPNFGLATAVDNNICAGDTVRLSAVVAGTANGQNLVITPDTSSFAVEGSRSDSLALPDGTGIPYETSIYFTEFSPGQVLTNVNDLESICVNMEHSWMRDIEISLTCPNGQSIVLHNFAGQTGGQVFLGEPNDGDGFNPIPGLGYDYCWTPTATNPTWINYANTTLGGTGTLPEGDYRPFDPIADLLGCPLNGEWSITVTDLWPIDNGFIFNWSLKFKDELYPSIETFTPTITDWTWSNHPSVFAFTPDSIAAAPQVAGTAGYVFTVNDAFGCSWDTLVTVSVLPFTHPACFSCLSEYNLPLDTAVCAGVPVSFDASTTTPNNFEVKFESYPGYKLGNGNHPHSNPYAAPISVNSVGYNLLTNPIAQITSVCMDIETDFDADLNIYLRSPDGKQLELSTGNGGAGDNYKITCFTPTAVTPIVGSSAPFNGTYRPEGAWTALNNAVVNGDWKLMVSDGFGPNQLGTIKWWSIGFNYPNNVTYTWTNAGSLSCANCPNPTATPSATTDYVLTAVDNFNCQHKDTVRVDIVDFFPAPTNLDLVDMNPGGMTWGWGPVPGASGYEVSINNGPWVPANGTLSHSVGGLSLNDVVDISVRALGGSPSCPPNIASASNTFVVCTISGTLSQVQDVDCAGSANGSAIVSVNNANGAVEFFANGTGTPLPTGDLLNMFSGGSHFVVLRDASGCRDTVSFTIAEPQPLTIVDALATDVLCHGGSTGSVFATASGGSGTISFQWRGCTGGNTINNAAATGLFAGCYAVTATDANNCTATATVDVGQPAAYDFALAQDSVSCSGRSDGGATIVVAGGTPPYNYLWDNATQAPSTTGLDAGPHFVTVTDAANCAATASVEVLQPAPFIIDSTAARAVSCFGGDNGTATVFATGGTAPYGYLWQDNQNTQKALNLGAGTFSVTVSDQNGCTAETNVTVGAPAELAVAFANVSGEKCAADCAGTATAQPTGGVPPYSFDWANPNLPDNAALTGLCPGQYLLTVTDDNGCTQSDKVDIAAAVPLDLRFDELPPSCEGLLNGSVEADVSGGTAPYTYQWANAATSIGLQNIGCGSYTLTLTDALGCVRSDTAVLDCPPTIEILGLNTQDVRCFGQANGQIAVQAQGGSGTLSYLWSDPNAQINATATNLPLGVYTVTISDANGCNTTVSANVAQPPLLLASTAKTDVSCFGGSDGSSTVSPNGGTGPYTFVWSDTQTAQTAAALAAGAYTVTVSDARGCSTTATATLAQPASALALALQQTKIACFGQDNGAALATASGSNGAPFAYAWSSGQSNATVSNLSVGGYAVTATDGKGCTAVQNIDIQQHDAISVNVAFVTPTCNGYTDGRAAVNNATGGAGGGNLANYTYQWSQAGAPNGLNVNGLSGDQTYTVTATDQQGCSGVFSFFVGQPPAIQVELAKTDVSCFGFSDGTAQVSGVQGANPIVAYLWSNSANTLTINDLPTGNYTVTVRDNQGCTAAKSILLSQPPPLTLDFAVKALLCSGDSDAGIQTFAQGGTPDYAFNWSNGATGKDLDSLAFGVYRLELTDKNGCLLRDSVEILRPDDLQIASTLGNPSCFEAFDGRIDLAVSGGKLPYRFSLNGGDFNGSPAFIGLTAGDYNIRVRDGNGCITALDRTLLEPLPIALSLGTDTTLILGDSLLIAADVANAVGTLRYQWTSVLVEDFDCADTLDCSEISVRPGQSNTYRLLLTDANGCQGSAQIKVAVEKPRGVYVPTAFSPNGDANGNDLLIVHGKGRQVRNIAVFRVFDRWGELLYEDANFAVNDNARGWDGRFRGQPCDAGTYVWQLEAVYQDGFRELLSGSVQLLR
jgi:gliding motility-associated-like protein